MIRLVLAILVFFSYYQLSYSAEPECNADIEGELFYHKSEKNSRLGNGVLKYCDGENWLFATHTYGECKAVRQVACGKRNANAQCGDGYVAVGGHSVCWASWYLQASLAGECGRNYDYFHDQNGVQDVTSELYVSGFSKGRKGWLAGCHTKKLVDKKISISGTISDEYYSGSYTQHNIQFLDIDTKEVDYAPGIHLPKIAIAWCCRAPQAMIDKLKLHSEDYEEHIYWD
jgi:hypothetical protein